jgi:hypothetical protein
MKWIVNLFKKYKDWMIKLWSSKNQYKNKDVEYKVSNL